MLRQQRQRQVTARIVDTQRLRAEVMNGRQSEDRRAGKEGAGKKHDPDHRAPRRGRVGHGVETRHDMRQSGETSSNGFFKRLPGNSKSGPAFSCAEEKSTSGSKPTPARARKSMTAPAPSMSTALMICTQLVASIPPTAT